MSQQHQPVIYLDHHATTLIDPRVLDAMLPYLTEHFGNASSGEHFYGDRADLAVKGARQQVPDLLSARSRDVIVTSGATESINLAIQGCLNAITTQHPHRLPHVACTVVEHHAVLNTCRQLARRDRLTLTEIPVDGRAQIDLDVIEHLCADGLDLLCVMAANNEVGTIYPSRDLAAIARRHGVTYICDGAQSCGKVPLEFEPWGIDLLAVLAHKSYGTKGIGALLVRSDSPKRARSTSNPVRELRTNPDPPAVP